MSNFALNFNMFCDMIDQIIDYNKDFVARKGSMIDYLLLRVMQTKAKSKLAFSNIVMLTRVTLETLGRVHVSRYVPYEQ